MLPFDNKSEFQVIVDMPNGTTLEETARVAAAAGRGNAEAAGSGEPSDLRGHRVALQLQRTGAALLPAARTERGRHPGEPAAERATASCKATRSPSRCARACCPIAERYGARIKVAEVPPGPPVLETLVAEVYGPTLDERIALARQIRDLFEAAPMAWWTSIGTWKTISRNTACWSTRRRPRSTASPKTTSRAPMQVASAGYHGRPAASGCGEGRRAADGAAGPRHPLRSGADPEPEDRRTQRPAGRAGRTGARREGRSRTRASITRT